MPLRRVREIADKHPEMPVRDALDAAHSAPVDSHVRHTDDSRWTLFAGCALQGMVTVGQTPAHFAAVAGQIADAMLAEYRRRFGAAPPTLRNTGQGSSEEGGP